MLYFSFMKDFPPFFSHNSIISHILEIGDIMSIVPTNLNYTSVLLRQNLASLNRAYPFLNIQVIGNSVLGRPIHAIRLGNGPKKVFYSAAYHANEWITSVVLMKFIEDFCEAYKQNSSIYGIRARQIFKDTSIFLVPMVNPDGVDLVTGLFTYENSELFHFEQIARQYPSIPFPSGWKANYNGVDLNLQFPARWDRAKEIKFSQGFTSPAPRDFVGFGPLTEPESLAVYNFTLNHEFRLILAYHTQGEVIYWRFADYMPKEAEAIGKRFAASSGYTLEETPIASSYAGYKDWFIQTYNRPGYTIEAGLGENPLPISQFDQIYQENLGILVLGATL